MTALFGFVVGVLWAPVIYLGALYVLARWKVRRQLTAAERIAVAMENTRLHHEADLGARVLAADRAAGKDCRLPKDRRVA